ARRRHGGERRDLPELTFERCSDQSGDRVGAGAGKLGRDLDGGEIDLRQRRDRQQRIAEDTAQRHGDPEKRGRERTPDKGSQDRHDQLFGPLPRRERRGGSLDAVGGGVSSLLLTATLVPSEMRAKPVVTTRSCGWSPAVITASASFCCNTVTGRIATAFSFTT